MIKGKELNLLLKAIGKEQIQSGKIDDFRKLCKANGMTPKEVFAHFIDLESVEGTLSGTEKGDTKMILEDETEYTTGARIAQILTDNSYWVNFFACKGKGSKLVPALLQFNPDLVIGYWDLNDFIESYDEIDFDDACDLLSDIFDVD